mgnify:CR=1 FL=1
MPQGMGELLLNGIFETMYMTIVSTVISYIIGIPLGVIVYITDTNGICKNRVVNFITGTIINIVRSIPFLILLVAIMPFTRLVVGTSIGSTATIVPLIVAAVPFIARMVESSLKEMDYGIIEATQAMGASKMRIIFGVMLPEIKVANLAALSALCKALNFGSA